jgi:hypothetical protein
MNGPVGRAQAPTQLAANSCQDQPRTHGPLIIPMCLGITKNVSVMPSPVYFATKRGHRVLSDVTEGFITGFGMHSYILGLEAMLEIFRARREETRSGRSAD